MGYSKFRASIAAKTRKREKNLDENSIIGYNYVADRGIFYFF